MGPDVGKSIAVHADAVLARRVSTRLTMTDSDLTDSWGRSARRGDVLGDRSLVRELRLAQPRLPTIRWASPSGEVGCAWSLIA
jgi:hypothetical protein